MNVEKQWKTKSGHDAKVLIMDMGHRCGYVRVEKGSPCFEQNWENEPTGSIDVHGGVTFGSRFADSSEDEWWIGFDCNHFGDRPDPNLVSDSRRSEAEESLNRIFGLLGMASSGDGEVRTLEFCVDECEKMSEQIAALEHAQMNS